MRVRYVILFFVALAVGAALFLVARDQAKRRAESIGCGNYMVAIGFAARLWASDHDDHLPADFLTMSNELIMTEILICPGDHSRKPALSWTSFTPEHSSFEMVTRGLRDGDTNGVFLRCKIHGHVSYADGSVFVGGRRHRKS